MNPYFTPFNVYNRGYYHQPYSFFPGPGYYPVPFNNYVNNKVASNQQSIYNSGYMSDVFQSSNIIQSGIGCTDITPPAEPPVV